MKTLTTAIPLHGYAQHGRELMGCKSPVRTWESQGDHHAKWLTPIDEVRGEGNCGEATNRGEEACECVRKYRPDNAAGRIHAQAARLRTETSYKAGLARRVSTTSRSRSQTPVQVNGELVQGQFTLLSGEG